MTAPSPSAPMTATEYLAWERAQPLKHEFHFGEIFAMSSASLRHNAIAAAVIAELSAQLRGRNCRVLTSDQRVAAPRGQRYVYPDATVVCGAAQVQPGELDVLENPSTIVEVLSPSTEADDRGIKWEGYRRVPSVVDYLLFSQDEARIEHYQRQADGAWRYQVHEVGSSVALTNGAELSVDAIYAGVFELGGE
ncbi:MAG: Uma2 family endonuclease [Polyangiaceae bacterium]|nr:Uma2 family endonuclease [Polyangiaceae bacterium]